MVFNNATRIVKLILVLSLVTHVFAIDKKDQLKRIKKRVAVFVFDDKTDKSSRWWDNKGVGEGIAEMITTELVKSGRYRVIERQELDQILKEQKLGMSGIVTEQSAAEVGKVLGVELAIMGAVTEFGYKKSDTGGSLKGVGVGINSQSATVGLDCRMVNTSTAEIVSAENVRKQKSSTGLRVRTQKLSFNDRKSFDESLVGKAARDAVKDVIKLIDKQAPKIPWQAKVVTVRGNDVFINAGSVGGVKSGDRFLIYQKGEDLVDPDTGLSLGSMDSKVGEIEVADPNVGKGRQPNAKSSAAPDLIAGTLFELNNSVFH